MPGRTKSSVYLAWPVMSRGSSRRLMAEPKMREGMALPHLPRRFLHRSDDVLVPGAAAVGPFEPVADLGLAGLRVLLQEIGRGQDHARSAEAALQPVLLPESLLQGMERAVPGQAFDRRDVRAIRLDGEHRAGLHGLPVKE